MMLWKWLIRFCVVGAAVAKEPRIIFQTPTSETIRRDRSWPYHYGISAMDTDDGHIYAALSPSQLYLAQWLACSNTADNMRNEVIKLNATALKTTHQNDTLVQFFTNSDCTGEKAYVYLQGDMCGRFNQNIGGIYFYWRSVYVPAHATLEFRKSSTDYQCSHSSVYNRDVWTLHNHGSFPICLPRPSLHEYAYHVEMLFHNRSFVSARAIFSPATFYDSIVRKDASVLSSLSPYVVQMVVRRHHVHLLFQNPLRCHSKQSYLVALRTDDLALIGSQVLTNAVSHPLTMSSSPYHHTPVRMVLYEDLLVVVFYEQDFSPVMVYNATTLHPTDLYVYFRVDRVEGQQTITTFISQFHHALLVDDTIWLFSENNLVIVQMENILNSVGNHNTTFTNVMFSEGFIHSLTYDAKKHRVYAMAHSRLFIFDADDATLIPYSTCSRIKEYDSTWGLQGPMTIDANKGHGYIYPSGSIQRLTLRNYDVAGGDGTYFTDVALQESMRRGTFVTTMHINHANVSAVHASTHQLVVGVHPTSVDFQPPLMLLYDEPKCARGRAGVGECQICSPGTYTNTEGEPHCKPCQHGRYTTSNESIDCRECPVGKHSITPTLCNPCAFGKYADETGLTHCKNCPQDFFHMQIASTTFQDCLRCPKGKITAYEGASACVECPPGRIKGATIGLCEPCSRGRYRASGQTSCNPCPVGKYGLIGGYTSEDDCHDCPAGTYGILSSHSQNHSSKEESCMVCPTGKISYSGSSSKSECFDCMLGKTSLAGEENCQACRAGTYTKVPGASCESCPAGKMNRLNGSVVCEPCPENSVATMARTSCVCEKGFYGRPDQGGCKPCPPGAQCLDKNLHVTQLLSNIGYWRHSSVSVEFHPCKEFHACSGGRWNQSCREGHHGPMCNICNREYAKSDGLCAACPPEKRGLNLFISFLAPVALVVILVLLIRSANPKNGEIDHFSGVSKIATSYMQVYSLCSQFDVKWPPMVRTLFDFSDHVNPTISFYSSDCSFQWTFFDRLWFYLLMPPIYVAGVLCTLYGLQRYYKEPQFLTRWLYPSVVVGIFLAYPSIIKMFLRVLSCDNIGEKYYLSTDYSVQCYTEEHAVFSILSVIALVLYGIGFPLKAFLILHHYQHRLYDTIPRTMHFLYNSYRLYYWEFVILSRKIAIVCMSVFLFRQNSERYQAVAVSWLLQLYMFLHLKFKPFDIQTVYGRLCDRLEWLGLSSTLITINAGIVFGTTKDDYHLSTFENVLLVIVVCINIIVFFIFMYFLIITGSRKALMKFLDVCGDKIPIPVRENMQQVIEKTDVEVMQNVVVEEEKEVVEGVKQLERHLQSMRRRGSSVVTHFEKLHSVLETMYKEQRFEWQKYVQMCKDLDAIDDPEHSEMVDDIKRMFKHEQEQHLLWLKRTIEGKHDEDSSDEKDKLDAAPLHEVESDDVVLEVCV